MCFGFGWRFVGLGISVDRFMFVSRVDNVYGSGTGSSDGCTIWIPI